MVEITTLCERLAKLYAQLATQTKNYDAEAVADARTKLEQLTTDLDTVVRALEPFAAILDQAEIACGGECLSLAEVERMRPSILDYRKAREALSSLGGE